jgi:hypothetical protein
MASPEDGQQQIWRPRTPAQQRLAAPPQDFRHFRRGDRVGVFLGCAWTGGVVDQVGSASVLVRARRLGCRHFSSLRVCDARNLVPASSCAPLPPDPRGPREGSQGGVL